MPCQNREMGRGAASSPWVAGVLAAASLVAACNAFLGDDEIAPIRIDPPSEAGIDASTPGDAPEGGLPDAPADAPAGDAAPKCKSFDDGFEAPWAASPAWSEHREGTAEITTVTDNRPGSGGTRAIDFISSDPASTTWLSRNVDQ